MPKPGDVLDHRYEILAELGTGGFATVYRAKHVGLLSDHAVKVLHAHLAEDTELRTRFLAEGRIQARLRHPNIVAVTDIVSDPCPGLVMEFVEGPNLAEYARERGGRLTNEELIELFLPVVDAVATAHESGVIHRDLKPENIIVATMPNGSREPRVADFGIAKVLDESIVGGAKQKTRTGMRMGTLHYMSPEQVRGEAGVDARTDVFSLGAILYELVTGRPAFAADSEFDTMRNIVDGKYEAPERVVDGLDPQLATCIKDAVEAKLSQRTKSARALALGLKVALAGGVPPKPTKSPVAKKSGVKTKSAAKVEPSPLERGPGEARVFPRIPAANVAISTSDIRAEPGIENDACWFCAGPTTPDARPMIIQMQRGVMPDIERCVFHITRCSTCRTAHQSGRGFAVVLLSIFGLVSATQGCDGCKDYSRNPAAALIPLAVGFGALVTAFHLYRSRPKAVGRPQADWKIHPSRVARQADGWQ